MPSDLSIAHYGYKVTIFLAFFVILRQGINK